MSVDNGTPRRPSPTENIMTLALAALTRASSKPDTETITFDTYSTGPRVGQYHFKLVVPRGEGETVEDWELRGRRLFEGADVLVTERNGRELRDKLEQSVAQLSGKRGAK